MSRLYGRSVDVFGAARYLKDNFVPSYKRNKAKTTWDEVATSPEKIELYLPESAKKMLQENPIRLVGSPLVIKATSILPREKEEEPTICFPRITPIEEYKKELMFFLGTILSINSPDEMPKSNDIPCEYSDILSLLIEYLYLKETNDTESFSKKHLEEILHNAKRYIKSYENYQRIILSRKDNDFAILTHSQEQSLQSRYFEQDQKFLKSTLEMVVCMSSMDAVLQIIDRIDDKEEIKQLLEKLIENKEHNRQKIINDMGIDSYGYKRLRKEIDNIRGR